MPCYLCGYKNIAGNGLDRQDTCKGYTLGNVEACCSSCNMMKAFYNKDTFVQMMKHISDFKQKYPMEWNTIECTGFRMGGAKTETIQTTKQKQWRARSIYNAVKADCIEEFRDVTLSSTHWTTLEFDRYTQELFDTIKTSVFKDVEVSLKKLVETIRYKRLHQIVLKV
jgi:hypothetical protein